MNPQNESLTSFKALITQREYGQEEENSRDEEISTTTGSLGG
jgi:hypothetical protein